MMIWMIRSVSLDHNSIRSFMIDLVCLLISIDLKIIKGPWVNDGFVDWKTWF